MSRPAPRIIPLPLLHELHAEDAGFPLSGAVVQAGPGAAPAAALVASTFGLAQGGSGHRITLRIDGAGAAESYRIDIRPDEARVRAADPAGLFYAVQTLVQLAATAGDETGRLPAGRIEDSPRFAYRGAMLDVARHFFPVSTVTALIDRLALLKLNHLHLHLTDDQGWRLELESRPELTRVGSSSSVNGDPGGFYTAADYREIVAYAAERFVTIVPEIDVPGHTNAALTAYPELADEGVVPAPYTGIEVGFSTLAIHSEASYAFLRDVFTEVAALTPGPYLHIGGDEALTTTPEDFRYFMGRAGQIAEATGKTVIGWHEAGRSRELPRGSVGQYWSLAHPREDSAAALRSFIEQGGSAIMSPADRVYLDMKHTAEDPLGLVWADGPTSAREAYEWDPAELVPGIGEADILGVEAPLWSETLTTLAEIDAMAFPRLLCAAEVAWSRAAAPGVRPDRSWDSFAPAAAAWLECFSALGIGYTRAPGLPWSASGGRALPEAGPAAGPAAVPATPATPATPAAPTAQ